MKTQKEIVSIAYNAILAEIIKEAERGGSCIIRTHISDDVCTLLKKAKFTIVKRWFYYAVYW